MSESLPGYDRWKGRAPEDEAGYGGDEAPPEDCDECGGASANLEYDNETGHWVCPKCQLQDALKRLEEALEAVPPEVMQKHRAETEARRAKPKRKQKSLTGTVRIRQGSKPKQHKEILS